MEEHVPSLNRANSTAHARPPTREAVVKQVHLQTLMCRQAVRMASSSYCCTLKKKCIECLVGRYVRRYVGMYSHPNAVCLGEP